MDEYESLSHRDWECKYHVVFIPKCRSKTLYGELRRHLGEVSCKLALQKESRIEEGRLMPDRVHMMIPIPPKYAVSQVVEFIKGKSAIQLARLYGRRNIILWGLGYHLCGSRVPPDIVANLPWRDACYNSIRSRDWNCAGPRRFIACGFAA